MRNRDVRRQPIPRVVALILALSYAPFAYGASKHRHHQPAAEASATPESADSPSENSTPTPSSTPSATPSAKRHKHAAESEESPAASQSPTPEIQTKATAPNVSVEPSAIKEFDQQPSSVRALLRSCLALAKQNLVYTNGSADPANGGMDCSGFIYYVLQQAGYSEAPRDASEQYIWARRSHTFRPVVSRNADSFEFDELLPGDLLFWVGTYTTSHDPPVTHTMIYLGTEKSTGKKIMIGSSDGRTYHGQRRDGVSVFDFLMPHAESKGTPSAFIGYARIPGLRD